MRIKWLLIFCIFSCAHTPKRRLLSRGEMDLYGLHGMISEAKICPTEVDQVTLTSRIVGSCEIVNCDQKASTITCWAEPEK